MFQYLHFLHFIYMSMTKDIELFIDNSTEQMSLGSHVDVLVY